MYYLVIALIAITVANTIWTLLDHKGMSVGKIFISCFFRIQFVFFVLFIVYFNVDLSPLVKFGGKITGMIKRKKNTPARA